MKIAVFHNLPKGGAKRVVDEQIKFLKKKHKVVVFTFDLKNPPRQFLKSFRLVKDFDNFISLYFHHKSLAQKIDRQNFDVVLVHPDKLTQAPYILRHLQTPTVYFCEELLRIAYEKELAFKVKVGPVKKFYENVTRRIRKYIDKENAHHATRIVVASNYIKNKVKAAYAVDALVCPLAVDTKIFKKYASKNKNINQLLFIGEPDSINGYEFANKIAAKTNLPLKVIFGWKLTDKEMAEQYGSSVATLATSHNEPFGLVPLEVQSCQGIVLAVNEGGYKETIQNEKTGFLLPRKVDVFAKKIKWLVKNENKTANIKISARQHIIKNYTWETHGRCLEKLLKLQ